MTPNERKALLRAGWLSVSCDFETTLQAYQSLRKICGAVEGDVPFDEVLTELPRVLQVQVQYELATLEKKR